ncbi:hypothetical protein ACN42_g1281 [Penicillium freii]|uniref:Uncharacterized protein n=1 Tax=Penicillium freii TaxID=48697 RepID=A0A101MSE8_PENFR|nr:hypothetical protein ACN42_g1281 [Penicillium freii]
MIVWEPKPRSPVLPQIRSSYLKPKWQLESVVNPTKSFSNAKASALLKINLHWKIMESATEFNLTWRLERANDGFPELQPWPSYQPDLTRRVVITKKDFIPLEVWVKWGGRTATS